MRIGLNVDQCIGHPDQEAIDEWLRDQGLNGEFIIEFHVVDEGAHQINALCLVIPVVTQNNEVATVERTYPLTTPPDPTWLRILDNPGTH